MRQPCTRPVAAVLAIGFALSLAGWLDAAEHKVTDPAHLARVSADLHPGDVVLLAGGTWEKQPIGFAGTGTAEKPITFRVESPGNLLLKNAPVTIDGEHVIVSGLNVQQAPSAGDSVRLAGRHCRLTDSAVVDCNSKFYVHMFGIENRLDHCYLAGKTSDSPTLQIEVEKEPNRHRIDHNHFGPRPPLGRNGGQPRGERYDAGCDQLSDRPVTNRPLSAADVGPSWR